MKILNTLLLSQKTGVLIYRSVEFKDQLFSKKGSLENSSRMFVVKILDSGFHQKISDELNKKR